MEPVCPVPVRFRACKKAHSGQKAFGGGGRFGEGRAEPLRHLTMDLNNLFDKLKNCVIKLNFNKFLIS